MENANVLIIGRLGELAKKIFELETLLEGNAKNEVVILEIAAYRQVLDSWPIDDQENTNMPALLMDFKLACERLVVANKDFEASILSKNSHRLEIDCMDYLKAREAVKEKMKYLNSLGRFVGNVPILSLTME